MLLRAEGGKVQNEEIKRNTFIGWHSWNKYEVFGLFQRVSDKNWWFNGCGEGMSFPADLSTAKMATQEEIKEQLENFSPQ